MIEQWIGECHASANQKKDQETIGENFGPGWPRLNPLLPPTPGAFFEIRLVVKPIVVGGSI